MVTVQRFKVMVCDGVDWDAIQEQFEAIEDQSFRRGRIRPGLNDDGDMAEPDMGNVVKILVGGSK